MRRIIFVLLFFTFLGNGAAQEIDSASKIDWETNRFAVELEARVASTESRTAATVHRAQTRLDQEFPEALFNGLLPLPVDSRHVIEDAVREDPDLASRIARLARTAERSVPRPMQNLRGVSRTYSISLFPDLTQLFVNHRVPYRMERVVRWVPTREFTGIVIYAAEPLPLHGSETGSGPPERVQLVPALLPEIYDTGLRPVLEQDMIDPAAIERWGVAHYTDQTSPDAWRDRAGTQPLRIMARRAFGIIPTDVMISPEDADRILASDHNRNLLKNGRIVIIVSADQIDRIR
ncbi:MAG: hypothetical protein WD492_00680 [Alkalispirochaeta sp.]